MLENIPENFKFFVFQTNFLEDFSPSGKMWKFFSSNRILTDRNELHLISQTSKLGHFWKTDDLTTQRKQNFAAHSEFPVEIKDKVYKLKSSESFEP